MGMNSEYTELHLWGVRALPFEIGALTVYTHGPRPNRSFISLMDVRTPG